MKICPDCNGKGIDEYDPNYPWTPEELRIPIEKTKCLTCEGKGKLTSLAYAIRKENGPPTVQAKGYA